MIFCSSIYQGFIFLLKSSFICFSYFQISGSQASSWLGLDNCSDDEDAQMTEDFDVNLVIEKPHFEGKAGEQVCSNVLATI